MPLQFPLSSSLEIVSYSLVPVTTEFFLSGVFFPLSLSLLTVISMVHRSSEVKGSPAVASFTCEQEVSCCHVAVTMGTVHVVAQTVEGVLHLFKYPLTNQIAAPISAHSIIQFTANASGKVSSSTHVS